MTTGSAKAGPNGQQISFCYEDPSVSGVSGGYAVATGMNQDGVKVTSGKIRLRGGGNCENLPNWWFKDLVSIAWHDHPGKLVRTTRCAVPWVKRSDWIDCDDIPVHDQLVGWLHQEISKNVSSAVVQDIQRRYGNGGGDRMRALAEWFQKVKPHGPWDHKDYLAARFNGRAYQIVDGRYYFQWGTRYVLSYDFWSNFHYGFVGRSAGIDAETLRRDHRSFLSGRTDPGDVLSVDMGIDFYSEFGRGEDPSSLAEFLDGHAADLLRTGVARPTTYKRLWASRIPASYLAQHRKEWVSRAFDPHSPRVIGSFRCYGGRNGDHSKARLRIYNEGTHKWIGDSGAQPCDWRTESVENVGSHRDGQPLRYVLTSEGNAHTTEIMAGANP